MTAGEAPGCVVVGVGASAGGLEAYKQLLRSMPSDSGLAFVLVQHLDPSHESLMVELLSKYTAMPVVQIQDATPVRANHVYMIPPNKFVRIQDNGLFLKEPVVRRGIRLPIDYFFASLARARRERAICMVLSGTGSDGAEGLREVKTHGGMTLVQQPETADHDGMPRSAISTGAVDLVLPLEHIAEVILPYARHPYVQSRSPLALAESAPDHLREIIGLLHTRLNQDFSRYKQGTLTRRIDRRMGIRRIARPSDYLKLLREDPEELHKLFKDMLIGVTSFFRDEHAWSELGNHLVTMLEERHGQEPFRVWVPGCSTGEEAYSIAILLHEFQKRLNLRIDLQIFATDIDSEAIDIARLAYYPENITGDIPGSYLDSYFQREGEKLRLRKRIRDSCVFALQNLLSDPPFSNLDLICCRNLLIYLEADLQDRVFDMLHFALKPGGLLLLGSSESPTKHGKLFETLSQPARIYRKVGKSKPGASGLPVDGSGQRDRPTARQSPPAGDHPHAAVPAELSKRALLESFAPASVVVTGRGEIQYIQGPVRNYMDFPSGEPELDVGSLVFDGLKTRVRTALEQVSASNAPCSVVAPRVDREGGSLAVRVQITPLPVPKDRQSLYLMSFIDEVAGSEGTSPDRDQRGVEAESGHGSSGGADKEQATPHTGATARQLAMELQATREDLQSTIEELESANEELKASNEEVMSMNEELQTTNEELETSREELQSLNEELSTVNNQLHDKVEELEVITNDLKNLLSSTEMATLFLDTDLHIRRFTPATCRLMRVIDSDVGRPVSDLSPRVSDPRLVEDCREVLDGLVSRERKIQCDDERFFLRRITPFRTDDNRIQGVVVVYSDISQLQQAIEQVTYQERQQAAIARFGRKALRIENIQELFDEAAVSVADMLQVPFVKILRLEPEQKRLRLVAGVGWGKDQVGSATVSPGLQSQAGYTLQSLEPVIVEDLSRETRFTGEPLLTGHGIVAGMSVLIGPDDAPWGVLGAHTDKPATFRADESNYLVAIANILWEALARRRSEDLVEARLAEIQSVYQSAPIGLCHVTTDLRYLRVNRQLAEINGVPLAEHLGKQLRDVVPPPLADMLEPHLQTVIETGVPVVNLEVEGRTQADPEGARVWLVNFAPSTRDGEIVGINESVLDITDRKRAERALYESEQRLQRLVRSAAVGIGFISREGKLLNANDALLEIFSISREDVGTEGRNWTEFLHPRGESQEAVLRRLAHSDTPQAIEFTPPEGDSGSTWALTSVNTIDESRGEYVICVVDITAQKNAEAALIESEEQLKLAARLADFGIYYGDVDSGRMHWSQELRRILTIDADEALPATVDGFARLVEESDRERLAAALRASMDPEGAGELYEECCLNVAGGARWVLIQGRTVFRGRGEQRRPSRIAGVILDITERHQFEEKLREAQRRAEAASEAKSLFLANMSHEIRSPMTAILGYADVLDARLEDEETKSFVKTIKEQGGFLCDILDDILDLAKVEAGKATVRPKSCSLLSILAEIRSLMSVRAAQKSISLAFAFDGKVPDPIYTDPKLVRQILVNLVGNATKFTESGGVKVVTRYRSDRRQMEIAVIDTGIGIDTSQADILFQPFEQLDNSLARPAGGTGLGLAISKQLVGFLGGEITLSSRPGEGSTFSFTFDCGDLENAEWIVPDPGALRPEAEATQAETPPDISGLVLAAEDRKEIRVLICEMLESAGAGVEMFEDGATLLQRYEELEARNIGVDAILMDLQMPVMDGFEATAQLRSSGYAGPIIALSANVMQSDRERSLKNGFDAFIAKPLNRLEVISVLAEWMGRRKEDVNQPRTKLLLVEDDAANSHAQSLLLEAHGFEVQTARDTEGALSVVESFCPHVALVDLGLPDLSGEELLLHLKSRPTLARTCFICVSGRAEEEVDWQECGFHHYLRKPVKTERLVALIHQCIDDDRAGPPAPGSG